MLWFLRDYALVAVLLRASTLACTALLIGGLFFCSILLVRSSQSIPAKTTFLRRARRMLRWAACGLIVTQACFVVADSAVLMGTGGLHFTDLYAANYFVAGAVLILSAAAFLIASQFRLPTGVGWLLFLVPFLGAILWTSHSASRIEDRFPLMVLTGLHQLAAAIWIGGMPFLWALLGTKMPASDQDPREADWVVRSAQRYSTTALVSVTVLIAAGIGLGWFYTQSWSAVYGTAYGVVLAAKVVLLGGLLLMGGANFLLVRRSRSHARAGLQPVAILPRISRFSEVEILIGFTIILAAASLSAQPPAVDLVQNRLSMPEIAARMEPRWPRLKTPPITAMPAVAPMHQAMREYAMAPDNAHSANNRAEQAWSEYNHHWAGIVLLLAGLLALLGRWKYGGWARHWPLVFLGLALFLFFRADPEAWPLGPRGFWDSFYNPEDLEHRLFILLIVVFAAFEWSVQTHRLLSRRAALVFPAACIMGGALLLAHNHSLGNVKEELLANMSHTAIAICAVFAGASRWLEVRIAGRSTGRFGRAAAWVWPVCLVLIGLVLLDYREA